MRIRGMMTGVAVTLASLGATAALTGTAQAVTVAPLNAASAGTTVVLQSDIVQDGPPRELGGVNLAGYCQAIGHLGVYLAAENTDSWRCYDSTYWYGIDMQGACRWQYGNPAADATFSNYANPDSWYCFLPGDVGRPPASGGY